MGQITGELESRWHDELAAEGRRLVVNLQPEVTTRQVPASLVTQILNALLDNAFRHGRGAVTLTVREMGETVAIDVGDEGSTALEPAAVFDRGTSGGNGQGIGLALARAMAEASGARLLLAHRSPATFTLFLPGIPTESGAVRLNP